jgi:hypothetical protein
MTYEAGVEARIGISGTLEWKDKDGNILATSEIRGSIPLAETGMSVDEARAFINSQEQSNGTHD